MIRPVPHRTRSALVAMAVVSALLGGCASAPSAVTDRSGSATSASTSQHAGTAGGSALGGDVHLQNVQFEPRTVTIPAGGKVMWTNEDPVGHTVTPVDAGQWGTPGSGNDHAQWLQKGQSWSWTFTTPGTYLYYCIPHAAKGVNGYAGMVGAVMVVPAGAGGAGSASAAGVPDLTVVPNPVATDRVFPGPDGLVHITLETKEVTAQIADGAAYEFWTFGGTVPGPMLRIREGDRVQLSLSNSASSLHSHSVDLHAVTGPGGGGKVTQTAPGQSTSFTFQALTPGLFVYHCATPHIPSHIANGMYGMILVEPKEGLPPADREFYVMQGEAYTSNPPGTPGLQALDAAKLDSGQATYYLMNGRVGALTGAGAMHARVGETVRMYVGVGGFVSSSFHVIGEIFDQVWSEGGTPPLRNVQTTLVPAGGATIVQFKVEVPGTYVLVDHSLMRALDHGAAGQLIVEGPENPQIFHASEATGESGGNSA